MMNNLKFISKIRYGRNRILHLVSILLFLFIACNNRTAEVMLADEYYVCSMDPQVMEKQAGPCPICKMPLTKTKIDPHQMDIIQLNEEQMRLGNIKSDTIRSAFIGRENTLTGVFSIDQKRTELISARINGRIEHLHYKIIGEEVHPGDKLYDLYSKELMLAQEEYLLAIEKNDLLGNAAKGLIAATKNKLLLWGLSNQQINTLTLTKQARITNTIYSTFAGTIVDIPLKEGDYVREGTTIYTFADLNSLWVEAQLYSKELDLLEAGKMVEVIPENSPEAPILGKVVFVNPELQEQSKINLIRIQVDNTKHRYKPGMPAIVVLKTTQQKSLVLPLEAVIQSGAMSIVWLETAKGFFSARRVQTGIQNKNTIEIVSGVKEGECAVISGAYLLNSEYIFKRGSAPKGILVK